MPRSLYLASAAGLLKRIRAVDDAVEAVLLIGHNPGLALLARLLAGSGEGDALERLAQKYPTAGLAVLRFDVERWSDVAQGTGRLERFVTPHDLH
jgi:phosphohistidine phosphatase